MTSGIRKLLRLVSVLGGVVLIVIAARLVTGILASDGNGMLASQNSLLPMFGGEGGGRLNLEFWEVIRLGLRSLWMVVAAAMVAYPLGVWGGALLGRVPFLPFQVVPRVLLSALRSLPSLGLALVGLYVVTVHAEWRAPGIFEAGGLGWRWDWAFLVGALVLGPGWAATVAVEIFSEIARQRGSRRAAFSRSFGASEGHIFVRDLLPFALAESIRRVPHHFGMAVGSVCVLEFLFRLSGLGGMFVRGALAGSWGGCVIGLSLMALFVMIMRGLSRRILRKFGLAEGLDVQLPYGESRGWGVRIPVVVGLFSLFLLAPLAPTLWLPEDGADGFLAGESYLPALSWGNSGADGESGGFLRALISAGYGTVRFTVVAWLLSLLMGGIVGTAAGLVRGRLAGWLGKAISPILHMPPLPLLLAAGAASCGGGTLLFAVALVLAVPFAVWLAEVVRTAGGAASTLASVGLGRDPFLSSVRHAAPLYVRRLVEHAAWSLPPAALFETAVRFLGTGGEDVASLGSLARYGCGAVFDCPSLSLVPAGVIALLVLALYLVRDVAIRPMPPGGDQPFVR